jgi:hypothetical protein
VAGKLRFTVTVKASCATKVEASMPKAERTPLRRLKICRRSSSETFETSKVCLVHLRSECLPLKVFVTALGISYFVMMLVIIPADLGRKLTTSTRAPQALPEETAGACEAQGRPSRGSRGVTGAQPGPPPTPKTYNALNDQSNENDVGSPETM